MTHYNTDHNKTPYGPMRDQLYLKDIIDYIGRAKYNNLAEGLKLLPEEKQVNSLRMAFMFAGIEGAPFHAFARRYITVAYVKWMRTPDTETPDGVNVDDQGFVIEELGKVSS